MMTLLVFVDLVFGYGFNVETSGDHPVWHRSEADVFPSQPDPAPVASAETPEAASVRPSLAPGFGSDRPMT